MHEDEPDRLILGYELRYVEIYATCILLPYRQLAGQAAGRDLLSRISVLSLYSLALSYLCILLPSRQVATAATALAGRVCSLAIASTASDGL
jgi:hypothetical protein